MQLVPYLYIQQKLNNPEITFVFPKEFEPDSLLINRKTGVYDYSPGIVKYSDSLYSKYSLGLKSTINITDNDITIFSKELYGLDTNLFIEKFLGREKCYNNIKKGIQFIQNDESLLINNTQLNRWTYYDSSNEFDIIANKNWVKEAYNIYYENSDVEERYNEFEILAKQHRNIQPIISKGKKVNNNELLFLTNVHFIEKNIEKQRLDVVQKHFLINFDIEKKIISSIKYINAESQLSNKRYYINGGDFHIFNNEYVFPIKPYDDVTKESKYLSIFVENMENPNELIFKEILDVNIPNNYIKYNLNHNLHNYQFDKSLILLQLGEFVYDLEKKIKYKVPFPESEFDTLKDIIANALKTGTSSSYFIHDIFDKGDTIILLYKDSSKNLKLMELNKKTEKAQDKIILTVSKLENYKNTSSFSFNKNGEIYYLNNDDCIVQLE